MLFLFKTNITWCDILLCNVQIQGHIEKEMHAQYTVLTHYQLKVLGQLVYFIFIIYKIMQISGLSVWSDSDWGLFEHSHFSLSGLEPQETLLHFAARRGLLKVARFLLKQPGAREALSLCNKQGSTPVVIAKSRGHPALLELFSQWVMRFYTQPFIHINTVCQ